MYISFVAPQLMKYLLSSSLDEINVMFFPISSMYMNTNMQVAKKKILITKPSMKHLSRK